MEKEVNFESLTSNSFHFMLWPEILKPLYY
jgi:hypothetical protein